MTSVEPPHPQWRAPDKMSTPTDHSEFVQIDPTQLASAYPLTISSYVPRPIAFVSTLSANGVGNLAPFSYSGVFAHDPIVIGVGICPSRATADGKKDTLANIDETKQFVVCIMSDWFVEAANHCCANLPRGVDEFDSSGLTRVPSVRVQPPRVRESAVHYECELLHRYEVRNAAGKVTSTVVLGKVVMVHAAPAVCDMNGAGPNKPTIDFARYQPLARLGGDTYGRVTETFDLPRADRDAKKV